MSSGFHSSHVRSAFDLSSASDFAGSADTSASSVHAADPSAALAPLYAPGPMDHFAFPVGLHGAQMWPSPVRPGGSTRAPSFRRRDSISSVGSSSVGPHRTSRQSSVVGGGPGDGPYAWSSGSRRTASSASLARSDSFSANLERLGFDEPPSGDDEGLADGDGEYEPDQPVDQASHLGSASDSAADDSDLLALAKTMRDTPGSSASDRTRQTLAVAWFVPHSCDPR